MGYFAPVFLAYVLNSCGINFFREVKNPGCEPLVSCLIFLTAVFLLLWDVRLYPPTLRKLWGCGAIFLEFLVSLFVMENLMNDFWFPLETSVISALPRVADFEKDLLAQSGMDFPGILQILRSEAAGVLGSYILSVFFLVASLHATRSIDFRLIKCGPAYFLKDLGGKLQKLKRRALRAFGVGKRVKFAPKCRDSNTKHESKEEFDDDVSFDDDDDSYYEKQTRRRRHRYS